MQNITPVTEKESPKAQEIIENKLPKAADIMQPEQNFLRGKPVVHENDAEEGSVTTPMDSTTQSWSHSAILDGKLMHMLQLN